MRPTLARAVRSARHRRFFCTYLAFLGLTVVIGLIAYGISYVTVRDATLTASRQDLEYAVANVRTQITASFDSIVHLTVSPPLLTVSRATRPLALSHYLPLLRLSDALASFAIAGAFADEVAVLFFRPQLYVSSRQIATNLAWHYENFMDRQHLEFDEWLRLMRGEPYHVRTVLGRYSLGSPSTGGGMLLQSIPIGSTRPYGTVVIHVPEERFLAPVKGRLTHEDAFAVLMNRDREIVAIAGNRQAATAFVAGDSNAPDNEARGRDGPLIVMRSTDDLLGLEFIVGLPHRQLYGPVHAIGLVFAGILIMELIAGVTLASFLANRNVQPLRSILTLVSASAYPPGDGRTDEYEQIGRSLALLARDNRQLTRIVDAQAPLLASSFVEHLLSGKITDAETLDFASEAAGIRFAHPLFVVCLLSVQTDTGRAQGADYPAGRSGTEMVVAEQWRTMLPYDTYAYRVEYGTSAFVHNIPTTASEIFVGRLRRATDDLTRALAGQQRVTVAVAGSRFTDDPLSLGRRYAEAKSLHDYQVTFGFDGIRFADDEPTPSRRVVFELDQETALNRQVLSGNMEAADALLEQLCREVTDDPHPSEAYASLLIRQIEGMLVRLIESITFRGSSMAEDARRVIESAEASEPFAERFAELRDQCLRLCEAVKSRRSERDARLFAEIVAFIEENRSDPQLNLHALADEFRLSAGHVSRYFKQHAGSGFAEYLEHSRIAEAARLLDQTELAVAEIARRVGYLNANTFYKAFRRTKGESAGAHRRRVLLDRHHAVGETFSSTAPSQTTGDRSR